MKKSIIFFFGMCLFLSLTTTSCGSNKTGCKINEDAHVKMGRDGQLPTSGGKSHLFPKKMRRKR